MSYAFPYAVATLSSTGDRPINGRPIRDTHFNRLFMETVALASAIGLDPQENKTDLKTRLAVSMNGDGTYKRELLGPDDPSGNKRGTTVFIDTQWTDATINSGSIAGGKPNVFVPFAYSPWDEPPVFIACWQNTNAAGYDLDLSLHTILAISEIGVNIDVRNINGTVPSTAKTRNVAWICLSRSLQVWQDDVAWCLPPVRTGGK